jgi:WD40 repeat protein
LSAGLGDGILKVWELKHKEVVRTFKASINSQSSITSINMNASNSIIGASTNKGAINIFSLANLYPTSSINSPTSPAPAATEIQTLKSNDACIN